MHTVFYIEASAFASDVEQTIGFADKLRDPCYEEHFAVSFSEPRLDQLVQAFAEPIRGVY